jgi:hypothetical protein
MVGRPLHRRIHLSPLSQEVGPPLHLDRPQGTWQVAAFSAT